MDRRRLYYSSNRDKHAEKLHESDAPQAVTYGGLGEGPECLAGNVDSDDLFSVRCCEIAALLESTYCSSNTL